MPFTFSAPLGSIFGSAVANNKVPPIFLLLLAAILELIGFACLATLPESAAVSARTYGFQIIAGFGCGITISTSLLMVPFVTDFQHRGKSNIFILINLNSS